MKLNEISVPQLGANDTEVTVAEWKVNSGTKVSAGDIIGMLETTKTVVDLVAQDAGYIYLLVEKGAIVPTSSVVALIAPQKSQALIDEWVSSHLSQSSLTEDEFALAGVTLTKKALDFARASGIQPEQLPKGRILREIDVSLVLEGSKRQVDSRSRLTATNKLVIYGTGNGALTVLETVKAMGGIEVVGFIASHQDKIGKTHAGLNVYSDSQLSEIFADGVTNFIAAITDRSHRLALLNEAQKIGFKLFNAIHPRAYLSPSCVLQGGIHVKSGAIIETESKIGFGCIIDNGVIVPHHNRISDGAHLAPGVCLGSSITIGERALLGVGVRVDTGINIGNDVIVSPGSAVTRNLPDAVVAEGVPAKIIGERKVN